MLRQIAKLFASIILAIFAIGVIWLSLQAEHDQTITGIARVVDGDTIVIKSRSIRLLDIDAPESDQTCLDANGQFWPCGQVATQRLRDLLAVEALSCNVQGTDRYGRALADCMLMALPNGQKDTDPGLVLVSEGLAWGEAKYRDAFLLAKSRKIGIHANGQISPKEWRRGVRPVDPAAEEGFWARIWHGFWHWLLNVTGQ